MAEWSNAHRWKRCVPKGTAGSNPVLSALLIFKEYTQIAGSSSHPTGRGVERGWAIIGILQD